MREHYIATAKKLIAEGYTSTDRDRFMSDYDMFPEDADSICEEMEKIEREGLPSER